MSLEAYAHACAKQKGQHITKMLGKGQFGYAYQAGDGHVYKITKDDCEVLAAAKLRNNPNPLFVDIYDVKKIGGDYYLIEQSFTEHNSDADALFWAMSNIADHIGVEIGELLTDEFNQIMDYTADDELLIAARQLRDAIEHMQSIGIDGDGIDLGSDNYSYVDGKITLFDSRAAELSREEAREQLAKYHPDVLRKATALTVDNDYER